MKKCYANISHQFDVWHFNKSVCKRLKTAGNESGCGAILSWIQSISNHLWWCAQACNSDAQLLEEKWLSLVHHTVNKHSWLGTTKFSK